MLNTRKILRTVGWRLLRLTFTISMVLWAVIIAAAPQPWARIFSCRSQRGPLKVCVGQKIHWFLPFFNSWPYSSLLFNVGRSKCWRSGTVPYLLGQYCASKSNIFPTTLFLEGSFLPFCALTSSVQYAHPFPACRHLEQDLALESKQ